MIFSFRTTEYLQSLGSVLIKSGYEITGFNWPKNMACINKVEHWKKRNGKTAKVFHHFQKWVQIPDEMIKWRKVTKKGFSTSWVWADDPEYTYQVNEKFITRGDARKLIEMYHQLPRVTQYQ